MALGNLLQTWDEQYHTAPNINNERGVIDAQLGAVLRTLGTGVLMYPDDDSFLVSEGTGKEVLIEAGAGLAEHSTYGIVGLSTDAQAACDEMSDGSAFPDDDTIYIFAAIETTAWDSREDNLPKFFGFASDTYNGALLLASVTLVAGAITAVADLRQEIDLSGGAAASFQVTQTAHGFVVGDWLQPDGAGGYEKAQADVAANANTVGVVTDTLGADAFTLQTSGKTDDIFSGLTEKFAQFLDPDTAGAQTETDAFAVGEIRQVLGVAVSATAMIINIGTGFEIQEATVVVTAGKVLTVQNSLTLAGTDGETLTLTKSLTVNGGAGVLTFPGGGATLTIPETGTAALLGTANAFTNNQSIGKSFTDPAASVALNINNNANVLTANNASLVSGLAIDSRLNQAGFNATNVNALRALLLTSYGSGASGTITAISGLFINTGNVGAGTVTTASAFFANTIVNSGGGTLTNAVGFDCAAQNAGTNIYGFRGQINAASTRYNLYMSGTAQNYMAGNLGLGVTVPTAVLHLKAGGTAADSGPLKFTSGSFLTAPEAGVVGYNGRFALTESDATRRYIVQAAASTKTTAGAPYANDGYITIRIGGTDVRVLTTA